MKRTKGHQDYDRRMFEKLGVAYSFWDNFVRPSVRRIKGNKCEVCSTDKDIQIHHSSLKDITINTLLLLCRAHHTERHERYGYG